MLQIKILQRLGPSELTKFTSDLITSTNLTIHSTLLQTNSANKKPYNPRPLSRESGEPKLQNLIHQQIQCQSLICKSINPKHASIIVAEATKRLAQFREQLQAAPQDADSAKVTFAMAV